MGTSSISKTEKSKNKLNSNELVLSTLVGREILILSNQLENNSLYTKVVMVHENIISVDRKGVNDLICNIDDDQEVIVQFDYKGQRVSAKAKLYQTMSGRSNIVLSESVIPLQRRMFKRYNLDLLVRCAIFPIKRIVETDIAKLRWLQVEALNVSSGGILLPVPSKITDETFLLLNIDYDSPDLPNLILGQVKHTSSVNKFNYNVGIQFILNEHKNNHFTSLMIKKIPPNALEYTIKTRNRFDKFLSESLSSREE